MEFKLAVEPGECFCIKHLTDFAWMTLPDLFKPEG